MTMTDTEAKALALVNEIEVERYSIKQTQEIRRKAYSLDEALCHVIEREAATEARYAAELRELKERFSEAASLTLRMLTPYPFAKDEAEDILIPFIIPAPDPLVEAIAAALREASPFADDGHDYTAEAKVAAAAVRAHQKDTNA